MTVAVWYRPPGGDDPGPYDRLCLPCNELVTVAVGECHSGSPCAGVKPESGLSDRILISLRRVSGGRAAHRRWWVTSTVHQSADRYASRQPHVEWAASAKAVCTSKSSGACQPGGRLRVPPRQMSQNR